MILIDTDTDIWYYGVYFCRYPWFKEQVSILNGLFEQVSNTHLKYIPFLDWIKPIVQIWKVEPVSPICWNA